jgi:hypothetical protein
MRIRRNILAPAILTVDAISPVVAGLVPALLIRGNEVGQPRWQASEKNRGRPYRRLTQSAICGQIALPSQYGIPASAITTAVRRIIRALVTCCEL